MRKAEFAVPSEVMAEFVQALTERQLENSVTGTNEDSEILIEVKYDKEDSDEIDELEDHLLSLREELEEAEKDEEDEN